MTERRMLFRDSIRDLMRLGRKRQDHDAENRMTSFSSLTQRTELSTRIGFRALNHNNP